MKRNTSNSRVQRTDGDGRFERSAYAEAESPPVDLKISDEELSIDLDTITLFEPGEYRVHRSAAPIALGWLDLVTEPSM
ncbi:MAG: hypothetical protein K2X93_08790 [Candidatus Obscuribacterales bacterium]|nr:hypothetical protein [Candidatus Obscuribacterales bacterium]